MSANLASSSATLDSSDQATKVKLLDDIVNILSLWRAPVNNPEHTEHKTHPLFRLVADWLHF